MAKRTDLHRPSAIQPANYEFIACDYFGSAPFEAMFFAPERAAFRAHMAKTGGKFARITREGADDGSYGCDCCGARCAYVARFHHIPDNTYITTGMDCAAKMDIGNPVLFANFRKKVAAGIEVRAGRMKAQTILATAGLTEAWELAQTHPLRDLSAPEVRRQSWYEENTICDIIAKCVKYGDLSGKQAAFIRSLLDKIAKRAEVAAARAAAMADAKPVPAGRIVIEGTVLTVKLQASDFGDTWKMLVQHNDGWKVWGSVPSDLDPQTVKGAKVRFTGTVEASKEDTKFGFYKRPAKASLLTEVAA